MRADLPVAEDGTGHFLTVMVAVMVFLAALAMAGTFAVHNVVERWNRDVSGTLTIQVMPTPGPIDESNARTEANVARVLEILRVEPGVLRAEALGEDRLKALMEPWLGSPDMIADLPLPRLIDVTINPKDGPDGGLDLAGLARRLSEMVPGVTVDDHRLWLAKLVDLAQGLASLAWSVLALVTAATSVAVIQVTRSSLATHRPVIEVLHLIGAHDDYIARQFAGRAMVLGLMGGSVGLMLAVPALAGVGYLARDIEGGFVPDISLSVPQWVLLLALPVFSGGVAMLTTRLTVLRALSRML
ncbi:cell division protein FtsX [Pararhodospirillum oryzae]|nr:FtsX-like permease family protein [Pararhodospirillum oryzae]